VESYYAKSRNNFTCVLIRHEEVGLSVYAESDGV